MQIIFEKAVRWVTAKYLSKSVPRMPSSWRAVERGLQPNAIKVHRAARAKYPQITTYYTVRPGVFTDHSTGRALDLMIPNYRSASGKALGFQVAARANAESLGINYVIWNQHIWNVTRDSEGWRYMADRGGDSATTRTTYTSPSSPQASTPASGCESLADHRDIDGGERRVGGPRTVVPTTW